ncbi:MAG TPA: Nif3-like dinuclear metal center hexameric protein, partial [Bacteroidales bacterium]|nr:Nif3-like dinuclear metal center hexameric protein [Bacteroidales bacterium]
MIRKLLITFILAGSTALCISAITAREIVDRIIKKSVSAPFPQTVDVFKEGNPDDEVTGIAVCMFASMDVLRDAVKNKCNFVITHEPLYYNHLDATSQFKDDPVVNEKKKFITENHLIVWRFHDYLHSINPDPVLTAMADKLGWKDYCSTTSPYEYQLPSTTLKAVISHLKKKIPGVSFDVVGNPATKISKVVFAPG